MLTIQIAKIMGREEGKAYGDIDHILVARGRGCRGEGKACRGQMDGLRSSCVYRYTQ